MNRSLEVMGLHTGETPGPDLIRAVETLSTESLAALVDQLLASGTVKPTLDPEKNEVWPLVNLRSSIFGSGLRPSPASAGVNLALSFDPRFTGTGVFSNSVLRALLYSHGLVLEDPVLRAAELFRYAGAEKWSIARRFVSAAVVSLVEIAPLLESGIVSTFFTGSGAAEYELCASDITRALGESSDIASDDIWEAFEALCIDGLHSPLQETWQRIRHGDRSPPLKYIEESAQLDHRTTRLFIDLLKEVGFGDGGLNSARVVDNAIDVMASVLTDVTTIGGHCDVLCPSPLFARLLFCGSADPVQALRIHELSRVDVPNVGNLLVEDAVQIRSHSEAFAVWRAQLSQGLDRARQLRAELGENVDPVPIVAEVLAGARASILKEFRKSSFMRERLRGLVGFSAGAIGGALASARAGVSGVMLGAAGAAAPWLIQRFVDRTKTPAFLDRHYVVFERPTR